MGGRNFRTRRSVPLTAEQAAQIITLENGLRVVYKYAPYTRAVHCGFVINVGSRDDHPGIPGLAHFIEHMIFKGTSRRRTFHILNYLESLGGDLNAYTTKEKTSIYASIGAEYVGRATDLLTDILFHSIFPEKEIIKEKQVIAEEIDMYREAPDEAIFEDYDEWTFPDHNLGKPILGTKESIAGIERDTLQAHLRQAYTQGQIVYAVVGNVSEKVLNKVIEKYLQPLTLPIGSTDRLAPTPRVPFEAEVPITTHQAHEIIGGRGYSFHEPAHIPFMMIQNMLGGPAMNSRLNLNIREKYGLAYQISSFYQTYVDSGIWGIYYACEPRNLPRIRRLIEKELWGLSSQQLGEVRLNQSKRQLEGQLTLSYENLLAQMLGMAKDVLDYGRVIPFEEMITRIATVDASQIQEIAHSLFVEEPLSRLTYRNPEG